jgi:hypothetical protein
VVISQNLNISSDQKEATNIKVFSSDSALVKERHCRVMAIHKYNLCTGSDGGIEGIFSCFY